MYVCFILLMVTNVKSGFTGQSPCPFADHPSLCYTDVLRLNRSKKVNYTKECEVNTLSIYWGSGPVFTFLAAYGNCAQYAFGHHESFKETFK